MSMRFLAQVGMILFLMTISPRLALCQLDPGFPDPIPEGYMLIEAGIPTLCGFGPTGGNVHAPDEWVEIDSLGPTVAMYSGIIVDYCQTIKEHNAANP